MNYSPENIFYYIELAKKWKTFILINIAVITLVSTIIAFQLPNWYYSSAVIKPADEGSVNLFSAVLGAKGLSGVGKNLNIGGLQYSDLDYYNSLLSSRSIQLEMIKRFGLQKLYEKDYVFQTMNELSANSDFIIDEKSNMLRIGVNDKDPVRAKKMVEAYLSLLEERLKVLTSQPLRLSREYIEKRYQRNMAELKNAEDSLNIFQRKNGVIIPEEQLGGTFKAVAEIEANKLFIESQLSSVVLGQGENSPNAASLRSQISTLDRELQKYKSSQLSPDSKDAFVPIGAAPGLIKQYVRLFRNVTIQTKLLEMLYPLYEQAKMDEDRDNPSIVVIDKPFVPEYKVKPKRASIIAAGFGISIVLSLVFVLLKDSIKRLRGQVKP